jgi:hypothetical protein
MATNQPIISTKLANEFGKDYVKVMVALLKGNKPYPKVASGSLVNSINYKLKDTAEGIQIQLYANDYLQYVDRGRRPGTYPPIRAIMKWASIKGLPKQAAWAIRQNIFKFGIKPTRVISRTRREFETSPTFVRKYESQIVDQIIKNMQSIQIDTKNT